MPDRYNLIFKPGGKVRFNGVGYPESALWQGDADSETIVVKIPGHSYWSGIGQQGYVGAQFLVLARVSDESGDFVWWRPVVTFPVTKAKK